MTNDGLPRNAIAAALALLAWLGSAAVATASGVSVRVTARDGKPVADVAVYAVPKAFAQSAAPAEPSRTRPPVEATMDQRDHAFVPHVLIVETGTLVHFPNNDAVSHHVYSFSPTRSFELPLYKGTLHPPLPFDTPGLVTLGCNIHDDMLGYILVVDTPYFAKTDAHGMALFDELPEGSYSVNVWTPRLPPRALPEAEQVTVTRVARESLEFGFDERLAPAHDDSESTLTWYPY